MDRNIEDTIERFKSKFEKDEITGCWNWTAGKAYGYGRFRFAGWMQFAHRVAYQLYIGEIPDGLYCLHHCDNPSCVNPGHLFLGTQSDNMRDRDNKGRGGGGGAAPYGERNGKAILTEDKVRTIRTMWSTGTRQSSLAREFGVAQSTISGIIHFRNWKNI